MNKVTMRDAFLDELYQSMKDNKKIIIVTADFGAPSLDKIRSEFYDRVVNVGIAEQNAINISVGLALEGYVVYVYGIAPFISMRCFEQIRVNISLLSQLRAMNINIVSVGIGMSYSTSGPTHHCLEDLSVIKTLPNIEIFSPSDCLLVKNYVKRSIENNYPKYIRFDGAKLGNIKCSYDMHSGFRILHNPIKTKIALISTSYLMNKIYDNLELFKDILLVDLFLINSYDKKLLSSKLTNIDYLITLEEGFIHRGGLDAEINYSFKDKKVINLGLENKYCFKIGSRDFLHKELGIDLEHIHNVIDQIL